MEFTVDVDRHRGWGFVAVKGDLCLDDLADALARLWQDPDYAAAKSAVWDLTGSNATLRFDDVMALTQYIVRTKDRRGPTNIAIVAPRDLEFGMGRMFAALEQDSDYLVNVFRRRAEADQWLASLAAGTLNAGDGAGADRHF